MSFRRFMPQTHEYLVNELDAVEFNGFNSLGPGTLWSVFPLLAGQDLNEFWRDCWSNETDYFDDCPWIWKEFANRGYRTSYAEDYKDGSAIFNEQPRRGFAQQPVHYDFRHVALKLTKSLHMGGIDWQNSTTCYGARLRLEVIADRIIQIARAFPSKPYFHFSWTGSLTHTVNALSGFGDGVLLRTIKRMRNENLLENTILILLSDHGMRHGSLRQQTRQGLLEERLPLLYVVLPPKFKSAFPVAARNLRQNADRLTSAFDVHATLQYLLGLTTSHAQDPREDLNSKPVEPSRATSLFRPISAARTCEDLGLNFVYCACETSSRIPARGRLIRNAATQVVLDINRRLEQTAGKCAVLSLVKVTRAYNTLVDYSMSDELSRRGQHVSDADVHNALGKPLEVEFETSPGGAVFSAAVVFNGNASDIVIMSITRISAYRDDGWCIESKEIRPFCHCDVKEPAPTTKI